MKANRLDPLTFIALHTSANDDKIEVKGHSDKTNTHDIFILLAASNAKDNFTFRTAFPVHGENTTSQQWIN